MMKLMDPPETHIGQVVLVAAEVKDGPDEQIRVRVEGATEDTLYGTVVTPPRHATYLQVGDRVEFTVDEIEQVDE
jgi:hypothetical protein